MTESSEQALHPAAKRVVDWGRDRGFEVSTVEYPDDGARTAEDAANAVGCAVDQIVKSMIFAYTAESPSDGNEADGETELLLALTAGSNRVDGKTLAALAGGGRCGRADPNQVREATGYAIGGVPPFGHRSQLRTWIDPHLLTFDVVWAAAGTPRHVFPIAPSKLKELTDATETAFTG